MSSYDDGSDHGRKWWRPDRVQRIVLYASFLVSLTAAALAATALGTQAWLTADVTNTVDESYHGTYHAGLFSGKSLLDALAPATFTYHTVCMKGSCLLSCATTKEQRRHNLQLVLDNKASGYVVCEDSEARSTRSTRSTRSSRTASRRKQDAVNSLLFADLSSREQNSSQDLYSVNSGLRRQEGVDGLYYRYLTINDSHLESPDHRRQNVMNESHSGLSQLRNHNMSKEDDRLIIKYNVMSVPCRLALSFVNTKKVNMVDDVDEKSLPNACRYSKTVYARKISPNNKIVSENVLQEEIDTSTIKITKNILQPLSIFSNVVLASDDKYTDAPKKNITLSDGLMSEGLWAGTVGCLGAGLLFAVIAAVFAVINTATTPVEAITGIPGLYIWNTLAALFDVVAVVCWSVQFTTRLSNNVLVEDSREGWTTEGNEMLGYSFWLVVAAAALHVGNCVLVAVGTRERRSRQKIQEPDKTTNDILLY